MKKNKFIIALFCVLCGGSFGNFCKNMCGLNGSNSFAYAQTIDEAIEIAISRNGLILSKKEAIETAKHKVQEAQLAMGVNLNLDGDIGYSKSLIDYERLNDANQRYFSYGTTLGISKTLYDPKIAKLLEKSELDLLRNVAEFEQFQGEFALKIVEQYLAVLLNKEILESYESKLYYHQKMFLELEEKYKEGFATKPQLFEANAILHKTKSDILKVQNDYDWTLQTLKTSLGIDGQELDGDGDVEVEKIDEQIWVIFSNLRSLEEYKSSSAKNYPGHLKEEMTLQVYMKEKETIQAEGNPKVFAQASGKVDSSTDGFFGKTDTQRLYAGVGVRWNFYNGGLREERVETILSTIQGVKFKLEQQKKDVESFVNRYYNEILSFKGAVKTYEMAIESAREYLKSIEKSYELGLARLSDVEMAKDKVQNSYLEYKKGINRGVLAWYHLKYYGAIVE